MFISFFWDPACYVMLTSGFYFMGRYYANWFFWALYHVISLKQKSKHTWGVALYSFMCVWGILDSLMAIIQGCLNACSHKMLPIYVQPLLGAAVRSRTSASKKNLIVDLRHLTKDKIRQSKISLQGALIYSTVTCLFCLFRLSVLSF